MSKFVIVGSGITGCTAGFELAQQGHAVTIIEALSQIGGKVLSYCCKATDECSKCGACIAHTRIYEALHHKKITFLAGATVEFFDNKGKKTALTVTHANPVINHAKCTACNACLEVCPAKCITRYTRGELSQYSIDYTRCLLHNGKECNKCVTACTESAITGENATNQVKISADGVLVATGHEPYNAALKPRFGYSRFDNVLSGAEAEDILSGQAYLKKPSEDVAFIQCVGSRDPLIGRNYCSSVCCAYALRIAGILKYRNTEAKVTVYYIDIQNFDKTFSLLRKDLIDGGIEFIRGIPFSIEQNGNGKLRLKIEGASGTETTAEHDVVVLSVGMGPCDGADSLSELFGLERNEFGFFNSAAPNVFVAGTCKEPQTISDSIASACAVALDMGKLGK